MARSDYTAEQRSAWQAERIAAERARGQHSRGINQLPRYDAKTMNIFAQRPNGRPAEITPRSQWTPNQERIFKKIQADIAAARAGKKLTPTTAAETAKATRIDLARQMALNAPKGSTITATTPSTCLASLSWRADPDGDGTDGVVTYEFYRGGALIYQDDATLDEFLEWAESDSLGKTGNAEWFT